MYGRYRSKSTAGKRRKQYRKRATMARRRTGMRKGPARKNTSVVASVEKKYIEHGFTSQVFGKFFNSSTVSGYYTTNSSPRPEVGFGVSGRIGQKIFCTGCIMDVEIFSQTNLLNAIRYKYFVVRIPDAFEVPATDIVPALFDSNPFASGIYDWHSNLDPETQGQYKIITKGQGTIRPDSITGQQGRAQFRKYLRLNFPMKWDTTTSLAESISNQWRIILFADTGDCGTALTALGASMNFRTFFLDN